jgi:predicted dehydrogenase
MAITLGIIGTGNIFPAYLRTLRRSRQFRVVGIADRDAAAARHRSEETGLPALSVNALLASDATIILNLTPPLAHYAVGRAVLEAGKHFFTEKPLAASFAEGRELVALARRRGLRIGCAPDTFLGAGAQAVRALVDAATVGTIRNGTAHFMNHGPDHWHPNPDFFYRHGAGPLFDVGVYYVTHLVNHLGAVAEVSGAARMTHRRRVIPLGANAGRRIKVEVPTHVVLNLRFEQGAEVALTASFDVWQHRHPPIELYGDAGTITVPDPNRFGGTVRYALRQERWQRAAARRLYRSNSRGIGLIDMAQALEAGRAARCSADLALHVLEIMERGLAAARTGRHLKIATRCDRPAPLTEALF